MEECTERFLGLVKTLADKYPSENLLLFTHGKQGIFGSVIVLLHTHLLTLLVLNLCFASLFVTKISVSM